MRIVFGLGVAAMALASCSQPKELSVDGAWVRLGAVTGRPAAAYFIVHGGPTPTTLISATTDVAIKSEMHETMDKGGMSTMTPLTTTPPGSSVGSRTPLASELAGRPTFARHDSSF